MLYSTAKDLSAPHALNLAVNKTFSRLKLGMEGLEGRSV